MPLTYSLVRPGRAPEKESNDRQENHQHDHRTDLGEPFEEVRFEQPEGCVVFCGGLLGHLLFSP